MLAKVLRLFLLAFLLQGIDCTTRDEIKQLYQPTLVRLRDVANTKYLEAGRQYETLMTQIKTQQDRSKNSTQTQINKIREIIATAKKAQNISATTLACLKNQETTANRLTTTSLNSCSSSANTTALLNNKAKFNSIATVASYTVSWCSSLNPLDTQDESFGRCLGDKVPDLNRQINIIQRDYNELSNGTLHFNIKCLTDNAGAILGQIGVISYQINVCFFTPL